MKIKIIEEFCSKALEENIEKFVDDIQEEGMELLDIKFSIAHVTDGGGYSQGRTYSAMIIYRKEVENDRSEED